MTCLKGIVHIFQTDITYETVSTVLNLFLDISLLEVHSSADDGQFREEAGDALLDDEE